MESMRGIYTKKVRDMLKTQLRLANIFEVPKIQKVVLNVGVGRIIKDEKALEHIVDDISRLSGQKVVPTQAKKSIASFKTRVGMTIGYKVTLRGKRMYDFLDRLVHIALPRTKDFRGIDQKSVDERGNLTIGIKEHIVFPEVSTEHARNIFGFEITVVTSAKNKDSAIALYRALGFPFKREK